MPRLPQVPSACPADTPARRRGFLRGALVLSLMGPSLTRALEMPAAPVVLTLSGRVRNTNVGATAQFDMPMLERLPQKTFSTRTPWYSQARSFTGPLLRDVLAAAGAKGTVLRAVALNDYWVDIPMDDAARYDMIIARLMDDKPMVVRDKGPLFIVYPFDSKSELRSTIYYSRSAWQLRTIEVQ